MAYHNCDICQPIIEQMTNPQFKDVHDDVRLSQPIDLGPLDKLLGISDACDFYKFILRMHDQVRPSYAIAPTRGMPECAARNSRISRIRAVLATIAAPIISSGKRQVWSNHVDFVEIHNGIERPVATKWRAMFRLIVDDVASVPCEEGLDFTELGRLIDPLSACDPVFWKESFGTCLEEHSDSCENHAKANMASVLPPTMRVIDLVDQMIKPFPADADYAVLSYVWGNTNFFKLVKANSKALQLPGSLLDMPKPKTIYDAMIVAQSLDIRYLWIDALCIIQDDEQDKMDQVHRMGEIYTNAALTIVGARSGHADGGLWSSEHRSQLLGEGGGLRWLSAAPTLPDAVSLSAWSKRAWTYQEAAFSRRMLIFTEHQAYFSCTTSAWAEDYVRRTSAGQHELEFSDDEDENSPLTSTIERLESYPTSWSYLLEQYTDRRLTFESDVLIASAGVIASYLAKHNDVALCGLPLSMLFEYSLLWKPDAPLTRRRQPKPSEAYMFPSWSWAGWSGAISYDGSDVDYRLFAENARVIQGWSFLCYDLGHSPLKESELRKRSDHFLDTSEAHTSGKLSLRTLQQGTLIFQAITARPRIDTAHWNQSMQSKDKLCEYTGYYKLYEGREWLGSVHLEHSAAKVLGGHHHTIIVISTTGGQGPTYLAPLPHVGKQTRDETWQPLCDPKLLERPDDEMFNIMVVTRKDNWGKTYFRAGVGQVHKKTLMRLPHSEKDIWLE